MVGRSACTLPSALEAEVAVFRLCWSSRDDTLIGGGVIRDHFLASSLPPLNTPVAIPLITRNAVVTLVRVSHSLERLTSATRVFLLPALPEALQHVKPLSVHTFREPAFPAAVRLALASHPLLDRLALPPPRAILVHSPKGAGATTTVAALAAESHATLVRLPATHLLRHFTTRRALHDALMYYLDATCFAQPAILFLDSAGFLLPRDDHVAAASFVQLVRILATRCSEGNRLALVVSVAPDSNVLHPQVVAAFDVVAPLSIDPVGQWALELASSKTGVPFEKVRRRVLASTVTTLTETFRRATKVDSNPGSISDANEPDMTSRWNAISRNLGGMSEALKVLKRMLLYPTTKAEALRRFSVTPAKGVLLYGPPGTGKTHLVREAAKATNHPILPVDAAGLSRGEVGASERLLSDAFSRAERVAPSVMFFDEIDALFASSALSRLVAVLAFRMDTVNTITIVAATNRPWMVSKALLRPGRFEHVVKVPLPNATERCEIARVYAGKMELDSDRETCLVELAKAADGFSGADIAGACRRAAMFAFFQNSEIKARDLSNGFDAVGPSVSLVDAQEIENWRP